MALLKLGLHIVTTLLAAGGIASAYRLRAANQGLALRLSGDDIKMEVINKTSFDNTGKKDCLCETGQFWHWRIHTCIDQGGWGYECGFFPEEHHRLVCKDDLKCVKLEGTSVKYLGHHDGAVPASCKSCTEEDKCKSGKERHDAECLKQYLLAGEACATVRVSLTANAQAAVTEQVTEKASASAKATATATENATATATADHSETVKATASETVTKTVKAENSGIKVQATADSKGEAEVTDKVTAQATATAKATATAEKEHEYTAEAEASAQATAEASANAKAMAEETKCVDVAAAKRYLNLQDVPEVGPVLAAQIVAAGDKLAFEAAYAAALQAAQADGRISAEETAKALASAKAIAEARLKAEAEASDAAAWKAEAGAGDAAQAAASDQASANATAKATTAAESEAEAKAAAAVAGKTGDAQAAAQAKASAKAKADAESGSGAEVQQAQAAANAAAAQAAGNVADVATPGTGAAPMQEPPKEPNVQPPRKTTAAQQAAGLP